MRRNSKKILRLAALLLALALLPGLAACGAAPAQPTAAPAAPVTPAATMAPSMPVAEQRRILEENRELWAFPEGEWYYDPWFYTFTDLDRNGRIEVLAASTQGSGIFTYANFYEVNEDFGGVTNLCPDDEETDGLEDWPEIILDTLPCYYDSAADTYYYACEGVLRDGAAHQNSSWAVLSLKNGAAGWEYLGWRDTQWTDAMTQEPTVSCTDAAGNPISEEEYASLVERRCAGMTRTELKLNWNEVRLPEPTPEPAYEPAPAPAPVPTPAPASVGPQVVITKNPSSEALAVGGKTWFIAHASNALSLTWEMISPEGQVYSLSDAMSLHPGLSLQPLEQDTIAVGNVPLSVNGWGVRARFDGQGSAAYTAPAYLYVGDYVNSYSSVIQAYKTAWDTGNNRNAEYLWNNGLSEIASYAAGVGYALKDIDKDGTPELLIAGMGTDDFSEGMLFDLYTLVNGVPVQLSFSHARDRWYLLSNNALYNEASGGAAYSYASVFRKSGAELVGVEGVMVYGDACYYQQGRATFEPQQGDQVISLDEFSSRRDAYKANVFLPPLTKIA